MQVQVKFSKADIDKIMKEMVIIVDTKEQVNNHILEYFDKKKIKYETQNLKTGDYSFKLPAMPEYNITKEMYFPIAIEKKNSTDELASSIKDRTRFENEFIRFKDGNIKTVLLVEDANGYANIINHNYRSQYDPKAFLATLKAWEHRYNFSTNFIDKKCSGNFIYYTLRYYLYEFLNE